MRPLPPAIKTHALVGLRERGAKHVAVLHQALCACGWSTGFCITLTEAERQHALHARRKGGEAA